MVLGSRISKGGRRRKCFFFLGVVIIDSRFSDSFVARKKRGWREFKEEEGLPRWMEGR